MYHSNYYEQDFSAEFVEAAVEMYLAWCKENDQEPEIEVDLSIEQFEGNTELLDHVLYHAEIQGLEIDDPERDE